MKGATPRATKKLRRHTKFAPSLALIGCDFCLYRLSFFVKSLPLLAVFLAEYLFSFVINKFGHEENFTENPFLVTNVRNI